MGTLANIIEEQSLLLLKDKEAMIHLFNNLPDAPALKIGDKVKVLNIIDAHPTSGMSDKELEYATEMQKVFETIIHSINRGDVFYLLAYLTVFSFTTGITNQLVFVDVTDSDGNKFIAAIELDIPLSKALFNCAALNDNNEIENGGEMVVCEICPFSNFEEEYQKSGDIRALIEILGKQLGFEPENGLFYSAAQEESILEYAEILGMVEKVA